MDLVHSRISSCSSLNLPRFGPHLKRLCLRQNLISVLDPADFGPLTEVEDIDFYDNKIKHLGDALNNMHRLKSVFNHTHPINPIVLNTLIKSS